MPVCRGPTCQSDRIFLSELRDLQIPLCTLGPAYFCVNLKICAASRRLAADLDLELLGMLVRTGVCVSGTTDVSILRAP